MAAADLARPLSDAPGHVKGADRRDEWDLFTVEGSLGGDEVMPKLSELGY